MYKGKRNDMVTIRIFYITVSISPTTYKRKEEGRESKGGAWAARDNAIT